jgi:hypothetical protein
VVAVVTNVAIRFWSSHNDSKFPQCPSINFSVMIKLHGRCYGASSSDRTPACWNSRVMKENALERTWIA